MWRPIDDPTPALVSFGTFFSFKWKVQKFWWGASWGYSPWGDLGTTWNPLTSRVRPAFLYLKKKGGGEAQAMKLNQWSQASRAKEGAQATLNFCKFNYCKKFCSCHTFVVMLPLCPRILEFHYLQHFDSCNHSLTRCKKWQLTVQHNGSYAPHNGAAIGAIVWDSAGRAFVPSLSDQVFFACAPSPFFTTCHRKPGCMENWVGPTGDVREFRGPPPTRFRWAVGGQKYPTKISALFTIKKRKVAPNSQVNLQVPTVNLKVGMMQVFICRGN